MYLFLYPFCCKGEIPIEKNIIVADKYGNEIGRTYPKRAKGLIKSGRAEALGDCKIRILEAHALPYHYNTEEDIMSKVIDFDPRDFKFDPNAGSGAGSRMVVSDHKAKPHMVFELGSYDGRFWSQIIGNKTLEPDTDYVFRFALTGGFDDAESAVSQFIICPSNSWEDRICYALERSRLAPAVSKRLNGSLLRVYEIPFNTGSISKYSFLFLSHNTVASFFKAEDNDYYSDLEDQDYASWWEERRKAPGFWGVRDISAPSWVPQMMKQSFGGMNVRKDNFSSDNTNGGNFNCNDGSVGMSNENLSESEFAAMLCTFSDGAAANFSNSNIGCGETPKNFDVGCMCDGCAIDISNCNFTAAAFSMLLDKLGDGTVLDISNMKIDAAAGEAVYDLNSCPDGMVLTVCNARLSYGAAAHIIALLGDGCVLNMNNCMIEEDTGRTPDFADVGRGDGIVITMTNCFVPQKLVNLINRKRGDGCTVEIN